MTQLGHQVDSNSRISAVYSAGTFEKIQEKTQLTPTPVPTETVAKERHGIIANTIRNIQTSCNEIVDKGKKALKNSSLLVACQISKGQKSAITETDMVPFNPLNTNVMNIHEIKKNIGNYEVEGTNSKNDAIQELLTKKPKLKKILYHNIPAVESKACREKFVDHLGKLVADKKFPNAGGTIKLEDFLDKEGLKLYKAAVAEEKNSRAFRDAVLAQATEKRPGKAWPEQTIIWIGGPSASGKSFSRDAVLETVDKQIYHNSEETKSIENASEEAPYNLIVSVDGGIERELGQMRQLVLQAAFNKGFTGIQDLHKHTNLSVKGTIKKVALASKTMHLAIPATFANPKGMKDLITFSLRPKTKQIFAEVVGDKGNPPQTFQNSTYHMGNSRAWKPQDENWNSITLNKKIKYESKEYQKKYFNTGLKGSRLARNLFLKTAQDPKYIRITNDLIYLKEGELNEAGMDYEGKTTRVTKRQLDAYNMLEEKKPLEEWLKTDKAQKLTEPKVDLQTNVSFQQRITGLIPPV